MNPSALRANFRRLVQLAVITWGFSIAGEPTAIAPNPMPPAAEMRQALSAFRNQKVAELRISSEEFEKSIQDLPLAESKELKELWRRENAPNYASLKRISEALKPEDLRFENEVRPESAIFYDLQCWKRLSGEVMLTKAWWDFCADDSFKASKEGAALASSVEAKGEEVASLEVRLQKAFPKDLLGAGKGPGGENILEPRGEAAKTAFERIASKQSLLDQYAGWKTMNPEQRSKLLIKRDPATASHR